MKLIQSSVEMLEQQPGLDGLYKQIEYAGRTCYKSTDMITEASAKEFVDRMIKLGHGAMLEHGTVYLTVPYIESDVIDEYSSYTIYNKYNKNKYSFVKTIDVEDPDAGEFETKIETLYITTNLRVLVENGWMDDLKYICEPTEFHEKRITAKFTCDRGVSHEFVRHRVFSFAQESTRYCNYSKDKFNNELTFIVNDDLNDDENATGCDYHNLLESIELTYLQILQDGYLPQQARTILPNALKTELVMTGFESDWQGFFELRCSPKAHPDAQKLANELKELMYGKQEE